MQLNELSVEIKQKAHNSECDHFEVEYAVRGIRNPVGVAEFSLSKSLPKELPDKLPSPKRLEDDMELFLQR